MLLSCATSPAIARLRPGTEVGLNVSTLGYDEPSSDWDNGWRTSFTGGVVLEILQRGRFALVSGLRYVQQGTKVEYEYWTAPGAAAKIDMPSKTSILVPVRGEFRVRQDYLAVPVFAECRWSRLFVSLGPEIGILMSGRMDTESFVGYIRAPSTSRNIKDDLKPANLTLDAGVGFQFPMESHVGVVQARYAHGLTGVANKDAWVTDWKTRGVEVLTGVRW